MHRFNPRENYQQMLPQPRRQGAPLSRFHPAWVAAAVLGLVLLAGCNNGDGSGPDGNSTVQGNVASFSAGNASFAPGSSSSAGVVVRMMGTDLSTMTDSDGDFVMSGVPAGNHEMQFMFNNQVSTLEVDVPVDGTLTLGDIRCVGQQSASVGHMNVQMNSQMGSGNMNEMGNGMNGSGS